MCGLAGWFITKPVRQIERAVLFSILAREMEERGVDSWGVCADGKIKKGLGAISYGARAAVWSQANCLMIHTRAATTGKVLKRNAHPLVTESIVGCHNGQVMEHHNLNVWYNRSCEVDSEHIFRHIEEGEDLELLDGWGAIQMSFKDEVTKRIHLAGNPLHIQVTPWGVVWASTKSAVTSALAMSGLKRGEHYEHDGKVFHSVTVNGIKPIDFKWPLPSGWTRYSNGYEVKAGSSYTPFSGTPSHSYDSTTSASTASDKAADYEEQKAAVAAIEAKDKPLTLFPPTNTTGAFVPTPNTLSTAGYWWDKTNQQWVKKPVMQSSATAPSDNGVVVSNR